MTPAPLLVLNVREMESVVVIASDPKAGDVTVRLNPSPISPNRLNRLASAYWAPNEPETKLPLPVELDTLGLVLVELLLEVRV
jgi:hypothetical protein